MVSKGKKTKSDQENPGQSEFIRRFKANPLVFIGTILILVIVVIAFVFLPAIAPEMGKSGSLTFGSYDGVPINYVPKNYFANQQEYIARYYQNSVTEQNYQFASYQIWRTAFEATVVHTAVLKTMKDAGYTAPETLVDRRVAELPEFQENGRFSVALYRQMDNSSRMSLWKSVQDSITEERYWNDISGLRVPAGETRFIKSMASPERRFEMAAFPFTMYPETEVAAFAEQNPDLFRVTQLSKITITSSEREAKQVLNSVTNGTMTFEDAASTHSQDSLADQRGNMGLKMAYELSSEIPDEAAREQVINLPKGELSAVIKVPSGWAFFRSEEPVRRADTADATLLGKIRSYILEFERGRVEDWLIGQAQSLASLTQSGTFQTAAAAKGLEARNFGPVPINYGSNDLFKTLSSASIAELSGAVSNERFWAVAFGTPLHTVSEPVVMGNTVLVLYPTEESSADESTTGIIESSYPYMVPYYTEQDMRTLVMNSDKLQDNFMETFISIFWASN
ncbi:peptidylprolyl isomerase [Breznakiella homolactica]|uniref:SurA N-terminal domain-containing protein n=1 Tax=Breznakiella homolactica TaxID=2798577 RepID=A0A7T8BC77_9SPIR|nr:peptidyl-prolyl cis-trans isomerase [Breznakiella homolactica]QQO11151.1 SurA N-terminal domain-containing protein [Breznakiella homolactica]